MLSRWIVAEDGPSFRCRARSNWSRFRWGRQARWLVLATGSMFFGLSLLRLRRHRRDNAIAMSRPNPATLTTFATRPRPRPPGPTSRRWWSGITACGAGAGACRFTPRAASAAGPSELPDWRITCFFVDRQYRGKGVAAAASLGRHQGRARRAALTMARRRCRQSARGWPTFDGSMPAFTSSLYMFEAYSISRIFSES